MMDTVIGYGFVLTGLATLIGVLIIVAVGAHRHG